MGIRVPSCDSSRHTSRYPQPLLQDAYGALSIGFQSAAARGVRSCVVLALLALLGAVDPAAGQSAGDASLNASTAASEQGRGWTALFGREHSRTHVIVGLWALHPFEPQFPEFDWAQGFGVRSQQWLAAAFVNSYDQVAFMAALERYWWVGDYDAIDMGIGYRVGLLSGYDERLFALAGSVPALPFTGLLVWTDVGPFSLDVFYAYRGITVETGLSFH